MVTHCDVAIIGGGPAGSTAGSLLKKYRSALKVHIFERDRFPRDHVGESQLPLISKILDEIGVWDKVEAAGFPVKIGATYRWGRTKDLWDFEFIPDGKFEPAPRPSRYAGQRRLTAFQVDRAKYDEILLRHAERLGCVVREGCGVADVSPTEEDRVGCLRLESGEEVKARYYIDASGHSGILRRKMGVGVNSPTTLQNIAIWAYWRNAKWASTVGVGGTRVLVLSQSAGWVWFIPLGPDRTSIGLVLPVGFLKESGKKPEALYREALAADPVLRPLLSAATQEPTLQATKDWSFLAERLVGENWFLAGESAGFADPILAAGLSLAHSGAREVAYTILALMQGEFEPDWLRRQYNDNHRGHIMEHIRFADYWYSANGVFSDLKDYAQLIARDAGYEISPEQAWMWLGQGGFIDRTGSPEIGLYGLGITKEILASFGGTEPYYAIEGRSHFKLNLDGTVMTWVAEMNEGRISRIRAYERGGRFLPVVGTMGWVVRLLREKRSFMEIAAAANRRGVEEAMSAAKFLDFWSVVVKCLEKLVTLGWVEAHTEAGAEPCPRFESDYRPTLHPNRDFPSDGESGSA